METLLICAVALLLLNGVSAFTAVPFSLPTAVPTIGPTWKPTVTPTDQPTKFPTTQPSSRFPSIEPTSRPPTVQPSTSAPTISLAPSSTNSPTIEPSLVPTSLPTINPTLAPQLIVGGPSIYQFSAMQRLLDVSETEFISTNKDKNKEAMKEAIAYCMIDISPSSVHLDDITDDNGENYHNLRRLTQSYDSACRVDYTVVYDINALGYVGNPSGAYNHLTSLLRSNIENGNFTKYLHLSAASLGTLTLTTAFSNSVNFTTSYHVSSLSVNGDDDNGDGGLNKKVKYSLVGLVVGLVLSGLCILCVLSVMFYRMCMFNSFDPSTHGGYVDVAGITAANRARLAAEMFERQGRNGATSGSGTVVAAPRAGEGTALPVTHSPPTRQTSGVLYSSVLLQQQEMLEETPDLAGTTVRAPSFYRYGQV